MKLAKNDKQQLLEWGYEERDFPQIEDAVKSSKTKYKMGGEEISRDAAIEILGRKNYLSGIARSAFHFSAVRKSDDGHLVYFDSSRLFK